MKDLFLLARVGVLAAGLSAVVVACEPSPGTETGGAAGTATTGTGGTGGTADTTTAGTTGTGASGGVPTGTLPGGGPITLPTGQGGIGGVGGVPNFDIQSLCSSGIGGSGPGGAGGAGGAGGPDCSVYPSEGQGNTIGSVLPPIFEFPGYPAQSDAVSTISLADYFDCDGSKGIHALYVIESATWCRPCQEDAQVISDLLKGPWKDLGIQVVTLMVMDADFDPATTSTALAWRDAFDLGTTAVGIDPDSALYTHFCSPDTLFFPFGLLVDPRTMTVVSAHSAGNLDLVEALALQNQTP